MLFQDKLGKFSVLIEEQFKLQMQFFCQKSPQLETGGILIGKYTEDMRKAIVTVVGDPPSDSSSGSTWFIRGIKGLKLKLKNYWLQEELYYLGEWHYHPYSSPQPSRVDHDYMKSVCSNKKMNCKTPILVILGGDPFLKPEVSVTVYDQEDIIHLDAT